MKRIESIIEGLRSKGHRITKGRRSILLAFIKSKKPIAVLEMHEILTKTHMTMDKVSVYRELAVLRKAGIIHAVTFQDGVKRYELPPEGGHKHHMVCTTCQTVEDVDIPCTELHIIEKKIGKKKNFQVQSHSLEFYGLCSRCV
jgi:Fur family ferric uptake transcriptional regulator